MYVIEVQHIDHSFKIGRKGRESEVPVLKDVSLTVEKGEIACIVGRSGSGKVSACPRLFACVQTVLRLLRQAAFQHFHRLSDSE